MLQTDSPNNRQRGYPTVTPNISPKTMFWCVLHMEMMSQKRKKKIGNKPLPINIAQSYDNTMNNLLLLSSCMNKLYHTNDAVTLFC